MNPVTLRNLAKDAKGAGTRMTLVVPQGTITKLPGFPRGELLSDAEGKSPVYSYDPDKILAWLDRNGL